VTIATVMDGLVLLIVLCAAGYLAWRLMEGQARLRQAKATRTAPLVVSPESCETCAHFSLRDGQRLLDENPAFRAAAQVIPPWRMGRKLQTRPNEEYTRLHEERTGIENRLALAEAADETAEAEALKSKLRVLEATLAATPAETPLPPSKQAPADVLDTKWSQFGACHHHEELRAMHDGCWAHEPQKETP